MQNPSFEDGWTDVVTQGRHKQQQPLGWEIGCLPIGAPLRSAGAIPGDHPPVLEVVGTIPEIVHKRKADLPPHEQPGGTDPLILHGTHVLKVFSNYSAYSAWARQTWTPKGAPGDTVELPIHVRAHYNPKPGGDGSHGACAWRVTLGEGASQWHTFDAPIRDRGWYTVTVSATIPASGELTVLIELESRSEAGIDYFIECEQDRVIPAQPGARPRDGWTRRVTVLVREGAPDAVYQAAALWANHPDRQHDIGKSWDHALWGPGLDEIEVILFQDRPAAIPRAVFVDWAQTHYPTIPVTITEYIAYTGGGGDPTPPTWQPRNYAPTGTRLGWHAIGTCGIPDLHQGQMLPTVKLVQAIGDIGKMPAVYRVVRLIDHPQHGNLEGFTYAGDPIAQAEGRIARLAQLLEPLQEQFDFAEYVNEQDVPDAAHAPAIGRFVKRACEVAPSWLGLAHFSFSTGNPGELEWWDEIAGTGCFAAIAARGDALALHSYHDHRNPAHLTHHLLRHRYLYERIIWPAHLDIPMILTECGPTKEALADPTFDAMDWVRATDAALADDPVAMAQLYTVSDIPGWEKWNRAFRALYPRFRAYVEEVRDRANGTAPVPPVPVIPPVVPAPEPETLWFTYPTTHTPHVITSPYGPRNGGFHHGVDLRSSWKAWRTEILSALDGEVVLVGYEPGREYFGYQVQTRSVVNGDTVVCRYAHFVNGSAYVKVGDTVTRGQKLGRPNNTGQSKGDHLHFDVRVNGKYINPTDLIRWPGQEPQPPTVTAVQLGFNDPNNLGAGAWMRAESVPGFLVVPLFLGGSGATLDFSANAAAGQTVVADLRYSWSTDQGGAGTLPRPDSPEWAQFIGACVSTILNSRGVWGWEITNEANNRREFPHGAVLTPENVARAYNEIRAQCPGVRMSPGALDPFHASHGDPRDWLRRIYNSITGAEFVAVHGYTRGPDPALAGSSVRFTDDPLKWQYRNYPGCVTALLEALPAAYRGQEVVVTEINHLSKDGTEGNYGWVDDERAGAVIEAMVRAARHAGLSKLALYRWDGDEWEVRDKPHILDAVKRAF